MNSDELRELLQETLEDYRLSRSERRAFSERLSEVSLNERMQDQYHRIAFELARESIDTVNVSQILEWLQDVTRLVRKTAPVSQTIRSEALFSPSDDCWMKISAMLKSARHAIDICVFTITDNRITREIEAAHRRRVKVRVVTDNDKALDRGSDAEQLARSGIEVRVDRTDHHMHHKFAIFDETRLLTGSYNWTRSAAQYNEENLLVTDNKSLLVDYRKEFERLWTACELFY
jgi:phosphatidylserine/phosphatidylglycerophosphate/cardiolipin synthase-like enzyme